MAALSDFEYFFAETIDGVVQPSIAPITCDETNAQMQANGYPKLTAIGNRRIEAGNLTLRKKDLSWSIKNSAPFTVKPPANHYRGTNAEGVEGVWPLPVNNGDTGTGGAITKSVKRAFTTQSYTLPSRAFDILSVDYNGQVLLHPETGKGNYTITDNGVNPQTINIPFDLGFLPDGSPSVCQVIYFPLGSGTVEEPDTPGTAPGAPPITIDNTTNIVAIGMLPEYPTLAEYEFEFIAS